MRSFAVIALLSVTAFGLRKIDPEAPCRRRSLNRRAPRINKPLEPVNDLPAQWLWNDVEGTSYLTNIRNQHLPSYCGSCWAHAATSAISDRIKVARQGAWPDINISP